jgi:hypothetical protein
MTTRKNPTTPTLTTNHPRTPQPLPNPNPPTWPPPKKPSNPSQKTDRPPQPPKSQSSPDDPTTKRAWQTAMLVMILLAAQRAVPQGARKTRRRWLLRRAMRRTGNKARNLERMGHGVMVFKVTVWKAFLYYFGIVIGLFVNTTQAYVGSMVYLAALCHLVMRK